MIRRPPRSTHCISSAASDVYKRQIVVSLKTLCDMLREHNKVFSRASLESNIAAGVAIHAPEEPKVHTHLVDAIGSVLKGIPKTNERLYEALKSSVRLLTQHRLQR
eukprot:TRINITY_DN3985_c0_g1_i7.p2 TRINITY_DN3985_c0_g1~~TRINITY_DN3985_c0_g1_i7.p2  ORF type:complete len:114 (+),score=31.16 TRINITY_DN3985_c0_g1_i7:25-342(+)